MYILADTHVHLYPTYDLSRAFRAAFENFAQLERRLATAEPVLRLLFLTERSNCRYFDALSREESLPGLGLSRHSERILSVRNESGQELHLVAGRQIATKERLELLALDTLERFQDGVSLEEAFSAVREKAAVPVLNWSLGKWMFGRAHCIERMLAEHSPTELLVGDIAARPLGWGTPRLFSEAARRGYRFVAGSDPLPFAGEEKRLGRYASVAVCGELSPPEAVRRLLTDPSLKLTTLGLRDNPVEAVVRHLSNQRARSTYNSGALFPSG